MISGESGVHFVRQNDQAYTVSAPSQCSLYCPVLIEAMTPGLIVLILALRSFQVVAAAFCACR